MRFLENGCTDARRNMAFDEYCLQHGAADGPFFYLWRNAPSVIIGLNQNVWSEVNVPYIEEHGICLARRVTGGGAVYHDLQNLNYSIIRPLGHSGCTDAVGLVADALRQMGVPAETGGRNDIFVEGRKVSGYARRVWKDREIIHGTLMFDVDIATLSKVLDVPGSKMNAKGIASVHSRVANLKEYLPECRGVMDLKDRLQAILAGGDSEIPAGSDMQEAVDLICRSKFATWEWNYGHSAKADIVRSAHLACGTVEASICIDRGLITGISFDGDFIGSLPAAGLAARLEGVRYSRMDVAGAVAAAGAEHYFDGTGADEIAALITG